ncbi:hypothetical protein FOMG_18756 [Fusarium oxysporum f. sp. melonis 26406]|uniref:Uncharacterized protein n=1 Tax=Fusarium oxysporum f. sp. melonis 26406 TaxID=1089452 RepID=W9Z7H1_FUSOX|nr:hypothetical protein FOMG_18756 [Fusarium oxysporum f. sp. melonis 26406]
MQLFPEAVKIMPTLRHLKCNMRVCQVQYYSYCKGEKKESEACVLYRHSGVL